MLLFLALTIFLVSYAVIISEKVHRTSVALFGGILMVVAGIVSFDEALHAIDFNTIGLLIGMMILVILMTKTGVFEFLAFSLARISKGKPIVILAWFCILTALSSAILDNVTTILLIVPITLVITGNLRLNPLHFILPEVLFSNIGGAATLIGDPPNILIGSAVGLSFVDFLVVMGPPILLIIAILLPLYLFVFRKKLQCDAKDCKRLLSFDPKKSLKETPLLVKSLIVLTLVLAGFFLHGQLHVEPAIIAIAGAALLLVISGKHPEHILEKVEWTTIIFFVGLFVLVEGIAAVGVLEWVAHAIFDLTDGEIIPTFFLIIGGSAILSSFVDNIPFVATMIPVLKDFETIAGTDITPLWWALAAGAALGGNGAIVGASANLVAAGIAEKSGHPISFMQFLKIGFPMMLVSVVIASGVLAVTFFV
ncbi:MAG: ArsB/NhaD family transporter [Candidatus Doudnabacteria bacterium]|nr:ArsB/NhaD family transporter [Candidatus Doudnabacteria bacterium]MCA9387863.1 ArsB/NhaD family transporter [Candidatus Andersenbacteria bacterium]